MKINIVTEEESKRWVLYMMSEQWQRHLPNCTISERFADPAADINYYVNWCMYDPKNRTPGHHVGWFTHIDTDENERWKLYSELMDYCVCPSINTYKHLPPDKSMVLKHGINEHYVTKPTRFGIVAREYSSGRKQVDWLQTLKHIPNTEYIFTNGEFSDEDMPKFYKVIDYLLVLANNEGGPVPVLEALASNKPVIAPDVGWCWEYPCIKYDGLENLTNILTKLCQPVDTENMWMESSNQLLNIFNKLHQNNV